MKLSKETKNVAIEVNNLKKYFEHVKASKINENIYKKVKYVSKSKIC